jgi:hypothetical protein
MLVYDQVNAKLYIDGSLVSSQAFTDAYNVAPGNLKIGDYKAAAAEPFDGMIANLAIYAGDQSSLAASHYALGNTLRKRRRQVVRPTMPVQMAATR